MKEPPINAEAVCLFKELVAAAMGGSTHDFACEGAPPHIAAEASCLFKDRVFTNIMGKVTKI